MKLLLLLFSSAILSMTFAQQDPNSDLSYKGIVDQENAELDLKLKKCKAGEEYCGWYHNQFVINKGDESWRAVGNYIKSITFWYNDEPSIAIAEDENANELWVLRKVEVEIKSTYEESFQLYYNKGLLTYFYHDYSGSDGDLTEAHYFLNQEIVESNLDVNGHDGGPVYSGINEQSAILKISKNYQELFLAGF